MRFISRISSIITRKGQCFYDRALSDYNIGWGQQFFLVRISENEGIRVLDLAQMSTFDKGTTVKALQKLEELGYIYYEIDPEDRRCRHVYTTAAAKPVITAILDACERWNIILTKGMTEQEADYAQEILLRLAANAEQHISLMEKNKSVKPTSA